MATIDPVAVATLGTYSESYTTAAGGENIANLFASWGLFSDAPNISVNTLLAMMHHYIQLTENN